MVGRVELNRLRQAIVALSFVTRMTRAPVRCPANARTKARRHNPLELYSILYAADFALRIWTHDS